MTKVNMEAPARDSSPFDPPAYMESGSYGLACWLPARYLKDWRQKNPMDDGRLVENRHYGPMLVERMQEYQTWVGLTPDGGFGPATRAQMLKDGHDFTADAKALATHSLTKFMQPDGTELWWGPGIVASENRATAQKRMNQFIEQLLSLPRLLTQ